METTAPKDSLTFSQRQGYVTEAPEISVREDAPSALRHFAIKFAEESGLGISRILDVICSTLHES